MPEESVIVICPNSKCRREFEEPILLMNLSIKPSEQYDACPYCFTKLNPKTAVEPEEVTLSEEVLETSKESSSQALKKVEDLILGSSKSKEKVKETGCLQEFGYLANRPKYTPIPSECLLCQKMVDCMLRAKE